MEFQYLGYFLLAIIAFYIMVKIFAWPMKILFKLILNGVLGILLLMAVNLAGHYFNFYIGINVFTSLIAGFFGVPGVVFLIIFKLFL